MALQRIRLQSFAPLPSFRVWFLVPQNAVDVRSLKIAIFALPALKGLDIRPAQLILEMDSFELLDESSIDLLHEGDIVVVKAGEPIMLDKLKRKASVEKFTGSPKRRRLSVSSQESSLSSALDSSTSDTSASDSSTSGSGTSSSTDSALEDLKSLPGSKFLPSSKKSHSINKSPVARREAASRVGIFGIQQPIVPPGMGKASTHTRNKRRKLKRKYTAAHSSSQTEHFTLSARVNGDKMPAVGSVMQSSDQQPLPAAATIPPCSTIQPKKKIYGSTTTMKGMAPQILDCNSSSVPNVSGNATNFIPPSERGDIPKKLFVTSVEINWRSRHDTNQVEPQSRPKNTYATQLFKPGVQSLDWISIEKAWEKYKTLAPSVELFPDTIVAWKAFGLDPATLTPQASMLHLGKIVMVDAENVLVQPLTRPGAGCATFGRNPIEEDQDFADQTSHSFQEIWSDGWKLISHE